MANLPPPISPEPSSASGKPAKRWYENRWIIPLVALGILPNISNITDVFSNTAESKSGSPTTAVVVKKVETLNGNIECISLSPNVLVDVASGERAGVGMVPLFGFAVESLDFSALYFFAIKFSATGIEDQIGVWARTGINSGPIISVDAIAQNFSVFESAQKLRFPIASNDPIINLSKACF